MLISHMYCNWSWVVVMVGAGYGLDLCAVDYSIDDCLDLCIVDFRVGNEPDLELALCLG